MKRLGFLCGVVAVLLLCHPTNAMATVVCTDDALSDAASALLVDASELSPGNIAVAVRHAGSDAPTAHAIRVAVDRDAEIEAWLASVRARSDAPVGCGRAANASHQVVVARELAGSLSVVSNSQPVQYRVALRAPYRNARVVLLDARLEPHEIPIRNDASSLYVEVPSEFRSAYLLQLSADGPHGPKPVAERLVGTLPTVAVGALPVQRPELVIDRLNAARERLQQRPLRANRVLMEAAEQHARSVCEVGLVAHTLEVGANPEERLRARGLVARIVGESIARASDASRAFDAMLGSPVHAATLNDARFTDVGTGAAQDLHQRTCLVVLLAGWPRMVPPGSD